MVSFSAGMSRHELIASGDHMMVELQRQERQQHEFDSGLEDATIGPGWLTTGRVRQFRRDARQRRSPPTTVRHDFRHLAAFLDDPEADAGADRQAARLAAADGVADDEDEAGA